MTEKRWAEIDEDWRRKEERAMAQREANAAAVGEGRPLPYPNPWDAVDPTKVPRDASFEAQVQSVHEFRKICRPYRPKSHTI